LRKDEQAETLYYRALHIREHIWGEHHPETAQTLYDLAVFRHQQGNMREAMLFAERALKIRSHSLGDTHPKTMLSRAHSVQLAQELKHADPLSQLSPPLPDPASDAPALLDPLTTQEQRVLRLLVAGRSNHEIAQSLMISLNTVKTHVKHLFSKLQVSSRMQASVRARELSLL